MEEFLGFPLLMHLLYLLTKETIIRLARQSQILHPCFLWGWQWRGQSTLCFCILLLSQGCKSCQVKMLMYQGVKPPLLAEAV
jgi:hypothetical protein